MDIANLVWIKPYIQPVASWGEAVKINGCVPLGGYRAALYLVQVTRLLARTDPVNHAGNTLLGIYLCSIYSSKFI